MQKIFLALVAIFLLAFSACSPSEEAKSKDPARMGSEAISIAFMPNNPPPQIHVDSSHPQNTFTATLELRNKGAYPQPSDTITGLGPKGRIFISGYDPNIIKFQVQEQNSDFADMSRLALEGKSSISPNGGLDIVSFVGNVNYQALNVKVYEPTLMATGCFYYETIAETQVCIDPDPYRVTSKKVCQVGDKELGTQGAPIAVASLHSEPFAAKTQFKIILRNVGGGDVIKDESIVKCSPPSGAEGRKIERAEMDKVKLESASIGGIPIQCGPFSDDNVRSTTGFIKLINGEGYVLCELPSTAYAKNPNGFTDAYITPISIRLSYGYRITTERVLRINKEE